MEEVKGSIPFSSTFGGFVASVRMAGMSLGGVVAGEGSFQIRDRGVAFSDGSPRRRFVFELTMASRDRPLVAALRDFLGVGSVYDVAPRREGWLPTARLVITSVRAHREATIPFAEAYLLPSAKRRQFEAWRDALLDYERTSAGRWHKHRSVCSEPGCDGLVRGRGLCRHHYYLATGY